MKTIRFPMIVLTICLASASLQAQQRATRGTIEPGGGAGFRPQAGGPAVHGSGSAGMIPKWLDSGSIGDSILSEASGKIGIGTTSPGAKLSVVGMIETTLGGYKFPD